MSEVIVSPAIPNSVVQKGVPMFKLQIKRKSPLCDEG